MINKRFRKACGLLGCIGVLAFSGCERDTEDTPVTTNTTTTANSDYDSSSTTNSNSDSSQSNNGGGGDNSSLTISGSHMYSGERKDVTVDLRAGRAYNVNLICSNDGDSDTINVYANGTKIGSYQTAENRMGGNGWYVDQNASIGQFTPSSDSVVFTIETITDSWGTWPKELEISEVR